MEDRHQGRNTIGTPERTMEDKFTVSGKHGTLERTMDRSLPEGESGAM